MSFIRLGETIYPYTQLSALASPTDAYLHATWGCCKKWLAGDTQFQLSTSGSTGAPKPISLQRGQLLASAHLTIRFFGLGPALHGLVCLPTDRIAGLMMLVRGMEANMPLTVVPPAAQPFAAVPADIPISFVAVVPLQLSAILGDPTARERLEKCQAVIVGGAPVGLALQEAIEQVNVPIYATYGMTETVSHIALKRLNGKEKSEDFEVLDGVTVGQDARGCLTVRGPMTLGETLTTNDLVAFSAPERFRWLGRADAVINSGGVKVQPERIEEMASKWLYQQGIEAQVAALGLPDAQLGERVALAIEGQPLSSESLVQLIGFLKNNLPPYFPPKSISFLPQFPLTPTGKTDKVRIKATWPETDS